MSNNNANNNQKRDFFLNEDVTAQSVKDIIIGILEANKYDEENEVGRTDYIRKPIKLIVDTFGGSVYSGNALVSTIDTSITPVHTYCYGKAMSMGFIIFASGHKRFAHHLATFMYHQVSNSLHGKLNEIEEGAGQMKKLMEMYDKYILENTNLPKNKLDEVKKMKIDWFMFAEEAKDYGVVDELIFSRRKKRNYNNSI